MVNYREQHLDRVFSALADPTRRALVARLEQQESLTVSELAKPFPVSLPAIMKHLDVLSDAGLITRSKSGRTVNCQLTAATMKSAMDWLHRYERFWSEGLNRLERNFGGRRTMSTATATKPSLTIKRRFNAAAGEGLRRLDRPANDRALVRAGTASRSVDAETDLRVGGRYHITMHVPGDQHDVMGVYREIVPNEKLVFTWAWKSTPERESLVTVTFKPDGDGTMLTLLHEQFFDDGCARPAQRTAGPAPSTSWKNCSPESWRTSWRGRTDISTGTSCSQPTRSAPSDSTAETIGWTFDAMPMPDGGTYWVAMQGGKPVAELFPTNRPEYKQLPEAWMSYLAVDDVDARVEEGDRRRRQTDEADLRCAESRADRHPDRARRRRCRLDDAGGLI